MRDKAMLLNANRHRTPKNVVINQCLISLHALNTVRVVTRVQVEDKFTAVHGNGGTIRIVSPIGYMHPEKSERHV